MCVNTEIIPRIKRRPASSGSSLPLCFTVVAYGLLVFWKKRRGDEASPSMVMKAPFLRVSSHTLPQRYPYSDEESGAAQMIAEELRSYGYEPEINTFLLRTKRGKAKFRECDRPAFRGKASSCRTKSQTKSGIDGLKIKGFDHDPRRSL